jgi:hypothetical protein
MSRFIESLETRLALSVSANVDGATLYIKGDNGPQNVQIADLQMPGDVATVVSIDTNGDGNFTGPEDINEVLTGIDHFVINLKGGDDTLGFHIDVYQSAHKTLVADLGNGNNTFQFGFGLSQFLSNSSLLVDVRSGNGNDQANIGLNDIKNGSLLDMNLDLGAGDDTLRTNMFGDVANGSLLNIDANLGAGRDTYLGNIDYESFDVFGAGSQAHINVDGGAGNDNLSISAGNPELGFSTQIQGLLSIGLAGGPGDDILQVTLPPLAMQGGTIAIRESGDSGRDQVGLLLAAHANSTGGTFDAALYGGPQDDVLSADVNDDSGTIGYGPNAAVIVDGGPGHNTITTNGNAPFSVFGG